MKQERIEKTKSTTKTKGVRRDRLTEVDQRSPSGRTTYKN